MDENLVRKAQLGDRQALSEIWDLLTPKIFGYLMNVMRDKGRAEDVLQSTWLKVIEALPRYQNRGMRFSSWVFAIAKNECRQEWRKKGREIAYDSQIHDVASNDKTEDKIFVEQILSDLSEDDREILRLRYIADLPLNDIARILNINFVTVRVRLHRALKRARSRLMI